MRRRKKETRIGNNSEIKDNKIDKWESWTEVKEPQDDRDIVVGDEIEDKELVDLLEELEEEARMSENKINDLLPEGWKQQIEDEDLISPEGRDCVGLSPIGVACTGPTQLEEKLADRIGIKRKVNEENLLSEVWTRNLASRMR